MIRCLLSLTLFALPLSGQSAPERVLVPLALAGQLPGANGSLWETRLAIANTGTNTVLVEGLDPECGIGFCPPEVDILPGFTIFPNPLIANGALSLLLRVGAGGDDLTVHLRVQDVSRQAETWGTSIPVVRERDAFTAKFNLLDIPVDNARLRSLLRVYSFANEAPGAVLVQIYQTLPGQSLSFEDGTRDVLLGEHTLALPAGQSSTSPGYAQLPLWLLGEVPDGSRLRVEVTPVNGGRVWGFVSVTNNQTQHVTVIAP